EEIQTNLFNQAVEHRANKITTVTNMEELTTAVEENPGYMKAMWCGDQACEEKIKEETQVTSRCSTFEQEEVADTCLYCRKKAKEEKIKEETKVTSRYIPFEQEEVADTCLYCGNEAKEMVYWARAY